MDLQGTSLVVLSACNTGVGHVADQHGVTSLKSAFMAAGSETVVASLWSVSDPAALELMKEFHEKLNGGTQRLEALHAGMRKVRRSRPHPYYWAPFTLTGATGPLPSAP